MSQKTTVKIVVAGTCGSGKTRIATAINKALTEYGFKITLGDIEFDQTPAPEKSYEDPEVLREIAKNTTIDLEVVQTNRFPAGCARNSGFPCRCFDGPENGWKSGRSH